jgi:hypothetical protein
LLSGRPLRDAFGVEQPFGRTPNPQAIGVPGLPGGRLLEFSNTGKTLTDTLI